MSAPRCTLCRLQEDRYEIIYRRKSRNGIRDYRTREYNKRSLVSFENSNTNLQTIALPSES